MFSFRFRCPFFLVKKTVFWIYLCLFELHVPKLSLYSQCYSPGDPMGWVKNNLLSNSLNLREVKWAVALTVYTGYLRTIPYKMVWGGGGRWTFWPPYPPLNWIFVNAKHFFKVVNAPPTTTPLNWIRARHPPTPRFYFCCTPTHP